MIVFIQLEENDALDQSADKETSEGEMMKPGSDRIEQWQLGSRWTVQMAKVGSHISPLRVRILSTFFYKRKVGGHLVFSKKR